MSFGKEIVQQLYNENSNDQYLKDLLTNFHIFEEIYHACGNKFWNGCGSYLFDGSTYKYTNIMYEKQRELYNLSKNVNTVLEVGVYMGHSQLIMLLSNPKLKIVSIDIDNTYSQPAINVLKKYFPDSVLELHIGDSLQLLSKLLPEETNWGYIHIDGDHTPHVIKEEYNLVKPFTNTIVFDDIDADINWFNNLLKECKTYSIPNCRWKNMIFKY